MQTEITMPKLGLTMSAGTVSRWRKRPGESVREGEPLVEVATDKITYEVESPASGVLTHASPEGEEFACGAVIGAIAAGTDGARVLASPAARKLARERGVSLHEVRGSGPRGRVTLADVGALSPADSPAAPPPQPQPPSPSPPDMPAQRRAIFRKMTEVAQIPVAQVETHVRVDALRALLEARGDFGWSAYVVFALARLLRAHPDLRTDASTGGPFGTIAIGVAADTPHGLVVPVVRNADTLDLAATQREIVRLAAAARAGSLHPDDVGGACFSLSNVGPQGVERVAPLPDPPQTAILGIGAATQRPAVVASTGSAQAALVPAWMLTCVLSFDHRFVDGAPAARFLAAFAQACEQPGMLL